MFGQQKNNIILYHQNYHLIKKPVNHFLKSRCKEKHNSELFHLRTQDITSALHLGAIIKQWNHQEKAWEGEKCATK